MFEELKETTAGMTMIQINITRETEFMKTGDSGFKSTVTEMSISLEGSKVDLSWQKTIWHRAKYEDILYGI